MDRREEAVQLLKHSKAIREATPGCNLPLTRPRLSEWLPFDDRWLSIVALYYVAEFHNARGFAADDIIRVSQRVQRNYDIADAKIA
jgi:hypothetical protein